MADVKVFCVRGPEVHPYLDAVAGLRLEIFREFPYLYDGNLANERNYLETYARSPESLFVLVEDEGRIVGAGTGVPLDHEPAEFLSTFVERGFDPASIFYIGEVVLQSGYRGRGLGVRFFQEMEDHARRLGRFELCAFCTVDRAPDHPKRPEDYVTLDDFWRHRGYEKHDDLTATFGWKEVGGEAETPNTMTYWLKRLSP